MNMKWLTGLGVASVTLLGGLSIPASPATAGQVAGPVAGPVAGRAAIDAALAHPARLVVGSWRSELVPLLRTLPEWSHTRTVDGPLAGRIVAGTLRLPETVEVTGDTTIVAGAVELTGRSTRITTHGHDFYLLAVAAGRRASGIQQVFTIDTSNLSAGGAGTAGFPGLNGTGGMDGADSDYNPLDCSGDANGKPGEAGEGGEAGGNGTDGSGGGEAGSIGLPIPDGSQDSWILLARGGPGGEGGPAGPGGDAGNGGGGGRGSGDPYGFCGAVAGSGGGGGAGGDGGQGGNGGSGGAGGKGGNVNISYPPGYDRSKVTMDLRGGRGGSGGTAGMSGRPGYGGQGGFGGCNLYACGPQGAPGANGSFKPGRQGATGATGADGVVTEGSVISVQTNKSVYDVGEAPVYTIRGEPNSPIFWTSTKDGAPTGENHTYYGHVTDAAGRFVWTGPVWTENDIGFNWIKQVTIAGRDATVAFRVRGTGPWADWQPLGGTTNEQIASEDNQQNAYVRGTDNQLHLRPSDGLWQGLGGSLSSAPVTVRDDDYFDSRPSYVFFRNSAGAAAYTYWTSTTGRVWGNLGGYILGPPTAVLVKPQSGGSYLMVLARGGDDALWVNWQTNPAADVWSGWQWLSGQLSSEPSAVRPASASQLHLGHTVRVFVRNYAGGVSTRLFNGSGWEDWQDLGGYILGAPAAATSRSGPGTVYTHVLVRGGDNALYMNRLDSGSGWSGWHGAGGSLGSQPTATGNGELLFTSARGTDNAVHVNAWAPWSGWRGWVSLAGSTGQFPGLAVEGTHTLVYGSDLATGKIYRRELWFY